MFWMHADFSVLMLEIGLRMIQIIQLAYIRSYFFVYTGQEKKTDSSFDLVRSVVANLFWVATPFFKSHETRDTMKFK